MNDYGNDECSFDVDRATDIEVAMYLIRLMNGNIGLVRAQGNGNSKNLYFSMANRYIKKMTNPFAKKMLKDKMSEVQVIYNLPAG